MHTPELASNPKFATMAARKEHEAELDRLIETWTRKRDRDRTVRELLAAGIAASPSRDVRDIYADPHLIDRHAFVNLVHPDLGELRLVGPPWRAEGMPFEPQRAPYLGEHTDEVLRDVLGLSDETLADLRERDTIL
jgi:crotonobetainyl-CoA:carnitine CoA-transferase CaiB-like acyl-CoA transferase